MHDIEVHDGSMFRPFFASKDLLDNVLLVKHTIKPGQYESRSPVMKNKPYETRYYENYMYYVPTVTDALKIAAQAEAVQMRSAERKRQEELKNRPKRKFLFF